MRYIVNGALGRMGKHVIANLELENQEIVAKVDVNYTDNSGYKSIKEVNEQADCIIDFSFHTGVGELLEYAIEKNLPVVVATTGHTEEEKQLIFSFYNNTKK
jgi:4-hydroxy-tetrahydrodipicolinate reductase